MDNLTLFTRNHRARLVCSTTLALAALLSACGGGGGGVGGTGAGSAGQAAAPVAVASSPNPAAAAGDNLSGAAAPALPFALACAGQACSVAPGEALAALPVAPGAADAQGYLVASTDAIATVGEPPYPDLRALPTRVLPFEPSAFGDVSGFSMASAR